MRLEAETGIYNLLVGGTALVALLADGTAGIFNGRPEPGEAAPYLIWSVISDQPTNETGRDERQLLVDIRGVAIKSEEAALIGDAIEARLKTEIDVTGWDTVFQRMESAIAMIEDRDGKPVYHDGARFDIEIHQRPS